MRLRGLLRIYGLVMGNLLLTLSVQFVLLFFIDSTLREYMFWPPAPLPGIPVVFVLALIAFCAGVLLIMAMLQRPLTHYTARRRRPPWMVPSRPPPPYGPPAGRPPAAAGPHHRSPYPGYYRHRSGPAYYHPPVEPTSGDAPPGWEAPAPAPRPATVRPPPLPPDPHRARASGLELPRPRWLLVGFLLSLALGMTSLTLRGGWLWLFPLAFIVSFAFPGLLWLNYVYGRAPQPPPPHPVLAALTWGMFSTVPASIANTTMAMVLGVDVAAMLEEGFRFGTPEVLLVAGVAPLVEEFLKPLGLLFLLHRVRTAYGGMLLGVACGMGFAIIENLQYELLVLMTGGAGSWTFNTFARGVGSTVLHAVGPAAVGFALGSAREHHRAVAPRLMGAYALGVLMHGAWNGSATLPLIFDDESWEWISLLLLGAMVVVCIGLLQALLLLGLSTATRETGRPAAAAAVAHADSPPAHSRAEPHRAEPHRAEPPRAKPRRRTAPRRVRSPRPAEPPWMQPSRPPPARPPTPQPHGDGLPKLDFPTAGKLRRFESPGREGEGLPQFRPFGEAETETTEADADEPPLARKTRRQEPRKGDDET